MGTETVAPIPFQVAGVMVAPGASVLLDEDPSSVWEPDQGADGSSVWLRMVLSSRGTPFQVDRLRLRGPEGTSPLSGPVQLTLGEGSEARIYTLTTVPGSWDAPLLLPESFSSTEGRPVLVTLTLPGATADFNLGWKDQWLTYDSSPWFSPVADIEVVPIYPDDGETQVAVAVSQVDGTPVVVFRNEEANRSSLPEAGPAGVLRLVVPLWFENAVFTGSDLIFPDSSQAVNQVWHWNPTNGNLQAIPFEEGDFGAPSASGVPVQTASGQVTVFDDQGRTVRTYEALSYDPAGTRLLRVALHPAGSGVLETLDDGSDQDKETVRYRRLDTLEVLWQRTLGSYSTVGFSPDGSQVKLRGQGMDSSAPDDIEVLRLDGTTVGRVALMEVDNTVGWFDSFVLLAPDNQLLAVVDIHGSVWFFDIASGALIRSTPPSPEPYNFNRYKAAFSPDQSQLYIAPGYASR